MSGSPAPSHLLRVHSFPVNAICFSPDNERLYSGDAEGHVVAISTQTLRPVVQWQAHKDSILTVEEWAKHVVTYVLTFPYNLTRDNMVVVQPRPGQ